MAKFMGALVAVFFLAGISVQAGICKITIDRKACKGQESKAFEPYKGKGSGDVPGVCTKCNPTSEDKPAKDLEECKKKTEEASKILRKGTLSEKTITGKFDGKDVGPFTDKPGC